MTGAGGATSGVAGKVAPGAIVTGCAGCAFGWVVAGRVRTVGRTLLGAVCSGVVACALARPGASARSKKREEMRASLVGFDSLFILFSVSAPFVRTTRNDNT